MKLDTEKIKGQKYGRLTIIELDHMKTYTNHNGKVPYVKCLCDCGNITIVSLPSIKAGNSASCGCFNKELASKRSKTHGLSKTTEYSIYIDIKKRCYTKTSTHYKDYGGRGITICQEWLDDFMNFYNDMGEKPGDEYSIDRIDNNGNYSKENCKWSTQSQQCRNRRSSVKLEFNGVTKNLIDWAEELGFSYDLLWDRIFAQKWSIEKALTTPKILNNGRSRFK